MWNSCCQLFNGYVCVRFEGSSSFVPFLPPIPPCCFFLGCENVRFFCSSRNAALHYPFFTFLYYQEAFVAKAAGRLLCTSPCFMVIWRQLAVSVVTLWSLGSQLAAFLEFSGSALLVAQSVKSRPAMLETHLSAWARKTPWRRAWPATPVFFLGEACTEEPGGLWSVGSQRVRQRWSSWAHTYPLVAKGERVPCASVV